MPAAKLTTDEQNEATAKLDSSLSAIFEEKKVRKDVQAILAYMEITDCETFSPDVGLAKEGADKVAAAKVLAAWEAANERTKALRTKQADERSAGLPAIIPGGAFIAMRCAWEEQPAANLHPGQTLKPLELPSKSFLEWRYTQVDEGEFLTESLAEVTSQQEEAQQTEDTTTAGSRAEKQ